MKESPKWKKIKRKKRLQTVFLVAICLLCVIMYENGQGAEVSVELAEEFSAADSLATAEGSAETFVETEDVHVEASVETKEVPAKASAETDGRVDLNKASKDELMTIPGIGESKAEAILKFRTEHGPFGCIEDVMKVSGIKEGTFGKIKDKIKV